MSFYGPFQQLISILVGAQLVGFIVLYIGWTLGFGLRRLLQLMGLMAEIGANDVD